MNYITLVKSFFIVLRTKYISKKIKKNKYILLPAEPNLPDILRLLPLYLSIYKAGFDIKIYLSIRNIRVLFIYLFLGVYKFYFLTTKTVINKKDNLNIKNKINFDKYSNASIKRRFKCVDLNKIEDFQALLLGTNLKMFKLINNFSKLDFSNIYAIYFTDIVYNPQGPIFEYIKNFQTKVYTLSYNDGNFSSTLIFNKITKKIRYPLSPPINLFKAVKNKYDQHELDKLVIEVKNNLFGAYQSSDWMSSVGTSSYLKQNSMIKNFFNNKNFIFLIFPHIYWDASSETGVDIFENYKIWLQESVDFILRNTSANLIIKDHPANLAKSARDSELYVSEVKDFLDSYIEEYKNRFLYLTPDTKYSSLDLINISDCVLTVRGTPGVEGALLGKNVLFAGTGRYDGYGFGIFANNIVEYFHILKKISKNEIIVNPNDKFFAALYLHILWNKMTIENKLIKTCYVKKGKVVPKVYFQDNSYQDINSSLISLSNWINNPKDCFSN